MFRIDDPSAAASLPTPEAAGAEGFWTEGNPATGVPATLERASWFNMIQEELRALVVAGGLTPSKTNYGQILAALKALYGNGRVGHVFTSNDWVPLPGGLILQWCTANTDGSGNVTFNFPIAFPNGMLRDIPYAQNCMLAAAYSLSNAGLSYPVKNGAGTAGSGTCGLIVIGY